MSGKTAFAGLEWLAPGDPLSSDGYAFQARNPLITDFLLKIGALTHRHDAHAPMSNPTEAPTLTVAGVGGTIPNGTSIYVAYTLNDTQGGESLPTDVISAVTPGGYADPTGAPTAAISFAAGSLLASAPMYAATVTDGLGGETALGPPVSVQVPASQHAEVVLTGLAAITNAASSNSATAGWRLWRSMDGGNTWDLMATGTAATDTWTDDGTTIGDCSVSPPVVGSTGDTGSFTVTVPAGQPTGAQFINLYVSTDGTFTSPALLGTYPITEAGTALTFTALTVQQGSPPAVSTCLGGAAQIDPDTDILDWNWKRPVATTAALPTANNQDGDARIALDTHAINVWDAATSQWVPLAPGGTGGGGAASGLEVMGNQWGDAPGTTALAFAGQAVVDVDTNGATGMRAVVPTDWCVPSGQQGTVVTDTFTPAGADVELADHVADSGATWAKHPADNAGDVQLGGSAGTITAASDVLATYVTTPAPALADYSVAVSLLVDGAANTDSLGGVWARLDPVSLTGYLAYWSGGSITLSVFQNGGESVLQRVVANPAPDTLEIFVKGENIVVLANGAPVIWTQDNIVTAPGFAGVRSQTDAASGHVRMGSYTVTVWGGPNVQAAAYTFTSQDVDSAPVEANAGAAVTFTVPPLSAAFYAPLGGVIEVCQYGVGQLTLAGGEGVTLRSLNGKVNVAGQYGVVRLRQRAANEWVLSGDLA